MSKLSELIDAGLDYKIACGRHENRYGEDDNVWDIACKYCANRLEVVYAEFKRSQRGRRVKVEGSPA